MQLPYSEELNIEYLGQLFRNTTECYKFFWFKAIVKKVTKGKLELTYEELVDEMIADAWYMVTEYHLNLGPKDTLESLVTLIKQKNPELKSKDEKTVIIDFLKNTEDKELISKKRALTYNVPYRLQSPFLENLKGKDCNGVQREHNKKLNNGLPILHKVPPKRDYGRYFCIMAEKGGTSHGGLTEKLSPFFHAKKQEVNAYAVRQDTYKLNQRIRQMEFLSRYSIDTLAQLETYRQAKLGEIVQLTAERKSLYKTNPDSPRIQQVNTALKQLRQEERLCRKIAEHSIEVQQHLTEARRDRAEQQKQEQERARDRRPDITTR